MNLEKNLLQEIIHEFNGLEVKNAYAWLLNNKLDLTGERLRLWKSKVKKILPLLEKSDINYVLIKAFDVPFARMDDFDLLIEDAHDILKTVNILKSLDYNVLGLRGFYPFKLTATKPKDLIDVDIYYKPKWYDYTYAPINFISKLKIRDFVHDIEAFLPPPDLNIYIVATHGYSHGRITLEEIIHIINILVKKKPDLRQLIFLATKFHTSHVLFCYLKIASLILEYFGYNDQPYLKEILVYFMKNESLIKYFDKWINKVSPIKFKNFPISFPFRLVIFSGMTKPFDSRIDPSVMKFDELLTSSRNYWFTKFILTQISSKLIFQV